MRWLIIGSNSFSGASFVNRLLKDEQEIIGISRSEQNELPFRVYNDLLNKSKNTQFKFFQLDLNSQLSEINRIITKAKPNVIVNFAAQSMVAQSWDTPKDWFDTNASSFSELLQLLVRCSSLEKYIHFSTPEVYGSTSEKTTEDCKFNPTTPYAISRAAGDFLVRAYRDNYSFPSIITRASNVYGPGQQLYRLIPKAMLMCKINEQITIDGGGQSDRDFIHINDVCDALMNIVNTNTETYEFHISTENQIKIIKLVEIIAQKLGCPLDDFVKIGPERIGKDQSYDLSSYALKNQTSWVPKTTIEEGLESVLFWVEKNFDFLKDYSKDYIHKK